MSNTSSSDEKSGSGSSNRNAGSVDRSMIHNALGSAGAGIVSRLFTHPLDTAKARLQAAGMLTTSTTSNNNNGPKTLHHHQYRGPLDVLRKSGGIKSLYRGFGTVLVGGTPGTMLYLCSYDSIKQALSQTQNNNNYNNNTRTADESSSSSSSSFVIHFMSGMLAEALACIIYVPVDVLKERLQVHTLYRNSWHGMTEICKQEGVSGLYRGYGATLASFGPFSALYFMIYEQFKTMAATTATAATTTSPTTPSTTTITSDNNNNDVELPFTSVLLCSCMAGAIASWCTSPLDMAKLRLQVQRGYTTNQTSPVSSSSSSSSFSTHNNHINNKINNNHHNSGMIQILVNVYRQEGIRGLFRGAGARVLHFAPATTITMTCYETFRTFFANQV